MKPQMLHKGVDHMSSPGPSAFTALLDSMVRGTRVFFSPQAERDLRESARLREESRQIRQQSQQQNDQLNAERQQFNKGREDFYSGQQAFWAAAEKSNTATTAAERSAATEEMRLHMYSTGETIPGDVPTVPSDSSSKNNASPSGSPSTTPRL